MALRPGIFLDKDGTLLVDVPYNMEPAKMRLAPGAAEGIGLLARLRLPLIIVSNQPGIALGKSEPAELGPMEARLREMVGEAGAELAGCYWCPHHPEGHVAPYGAVCDCRKPAPGMLLRAAEVHGVDLSRSWMIGDILHDIEAGRRAGCSTILIDNGNETEWVMNEWRTPHHRVGDFAQAARIVTAAVTEGEGVGR